MSKVTKWYTRYRVPFLVSLIVISVAGSLILLAYQGARINEQVVEVKEINERLVSQSKDSEKQIERVIQENQKQTSYIECLLSIEGVFTEDLKTNCEKQAETRQQSQSPSMNSSPTPTDRPLSSGTIENFETPKNETSNIDPTPKRTQEFSQPTIQPQGTRETINNEPEEEQQQPQANSLLDDLTNLVEGVL